MVLMPIAKYLVSSFVFLVLVTAASAAAAQDDTPLNPTPVMGKPGTIVLDRLLGVNFGSVPLGGATGFLQAGSFGFSHGTSSAGTNESSSTTFDIRPSFDVFVSRRVTLGGEVGFGYLWQTSDYGAGGVSKSTAYSLSALPRIGYYLPLSDTVAFWPRVSVGGSYARSTREASSPTVGNAADAGSVAFRTNVDLDLAVALTKHLVLLAGPRLSATIAGGVAGDDSRSASVTASVRGSLSFAF